MSSDLQMVQPPEITPRQGDVILEGVVGFTTYGMAEASDISRIGCFVAPTAEVVGLSWNARRDTISTRRPLATHHEIAKLCRLILRSNPTVVELLWLGHYDICTEWGESLIGLRSAFLSTRHVYNGYGGQAVSRVAKIQKCNTGVLDLTAQKKIEKLGRQAHRLLLQGTQLLGSGRLDVRLPSTAVDACHSAGRLAASNRTAFVDVFRELEADFRAIAKRSVLPEQPDTETIERWLVGVRRQHFVD